MSKKLEFMQPPNGLQASKIHVEQLNQQQGIYNAMLMRAAAVHAAAASANGYANNHTTMPYGSLMAQTLLQQHQQTHQMPQPPNLASMQQFFNSSDLKNLSFSNILPLFLPMHS